MKYFDCPVIGERPASEFVCAGSSIEGLVNEDGDAVRHGLYFGDATARVKREWWWHRPSQIWFLITRDTRTDVVSEIRTASKLGDVPDEGRA
jgi:sarcosine oxidase subunit delta